MSAIASMPLPAQRLALVADDETAMQDIVAWVLRQFGLATLAVGDGAAAVAAVEAHHGALACAILDIRMPRMNGVDAAHAIQRIAPDLAIVLMSADMSTHDTERIKQLRLAGLLHKPFSVAALREVIRTAIADGVTSEPQ